MKEDKNVYDLLCELYKKWKSCGKVETAVKLENKVEEGFSPGLTLSFTSKTCMLGPFNLL